jgi:hypothetical protein
MCAINVSRAANGYPGLSPLGYKNMRAAGKPRHELLSGLSPLATV